MKSKKRRLNYKGLTCSDGVDTVKWYSQSVETGNVKFYHGSLGLLLSLPAMEKTVLLGALKFMAEENLFVNKKEFKNYMIEKCDLKPNSVNRAVSYLAGQEILQATAMRGLYRVNPLLFFCGTEKERFKLLRSMAESPLGDAIGVKRRQAIRVKQRK